MDKDELAMTGVPNPCPFSIQSKLCLQILKPI